MTQTPLERNVLYPSRDHVDEVRDEALAMLPITNPNDLLMVLGMHQNTILKQMDNSTHVDHEQY